MPLVQLMLFGYAINTDPKHLPTAVLIQDDSVFTRSFMAALRTSDYFDLAHDRRRARTSSTGCCSSGDGAVRRADPGEFRPRPDPRRASRRSSSSPTPPTRSRPAPPSRRSRACSASVFARDLIGPAASLAPKPAPYEVRIHRRYNPTGATRLQHRARPDGHHPDDDHGDVHGALGHARDRARHDGEPARRCRSARSRSCSARSRPTWWSAPCR